MHAYTALYGLCANILPKWVFLCGTKPPWKEATFTKTGQVPLEWGRIWPQKIIHDIYNGVLRVIEINPDLKINMIKPTLNFAPFCYFLSGKDGSGIFFKAMQPLCQCINMKEILLYNLVSIIKNKGPTIATLKPGVTLEYLNFFCPETSLTCAKLDTGFFMICSVNGCMHISQMKQNVPQERGLHIGGLSLSEGHSK